MDPVSTFPHSLADYPAMANASLFELLRARVEIDPLNAVATLIFLLAVVHTFMASRFTAASHRRQAMHDAYSKAQGLPKRPSVHAEVLHFFGEIEVVFALWIIPLIGAIVFTHGWDTAKHYTNDTVDYTEALFVVVIMTIASSRPIVNLAESALRALASIGGNSPAAWWFVILTVTPMLGSLITEPAAMTIAALLLSQRFFALAPSTRLSYATLGLLFVNISIGGTLTHFAAPPVLMVARHWNWGTSFMLGHFGWRAVIGILVSTIVYLVVFRRELFALTRVQADIDDVRASSKSTAVALLPVPAWITLVHLAFMVWTVSNSHYPVLFAGGFMFFLGFTQATTPYQTVLDIKTPLLVGFFLAGLVIHGGLQGWWIAPTLGRLNQWGMFWVATLLTAFNDNALITYLATLVPELSESLKVAVVEGAVTGGGLTVIANAPNPAGQALLNRFFDGAISPAKLAAAALFPTLVAAATFRWF